MTPPMASFHNEYQRGLLNVPLAALQPVRFSVETSSCPWNVKNFSFSRQLEARHVRTTMGPSTSKPFPSEQCPAGTRPAPEDTVRNSVLWRVLFILSKTASLHVGLLSKILRFILPWV